jgi:hypothetical protein
MVCGFVAAGKTTYSRRLEASGGTALDRSADV